jgi:uncharacterized protein (TIGR02466 family)
MSAIENLFPTPILFHVFDGEQKEAIQKEMASAVEKVEWVVPDGWGKTHKLSTKTFTGNDIAKYQLVKFEAYMDQQIKLYLATMGIAPMPYTLTSWFSKFDKGDYGHIHTHNHADISGVYYFKTNGEDGDIFFETPAPCQDGSAVFNKGRYQHQPLEGKMILFPGWLRHGIMTNETDETRISFAFNIQFQKPDLMRL